jgi:hypothetical protein
MTLAFERIAEEKPLPSSPENETSSSSSSSSSYWCYRLVPALTASTRLFHSILLAAFVFQ